MSGAAVIASGRDVFAREVTAAHKLGFELRTRVEPGAVFVRLQPVNARARVACERATGRPHQAIEAVVTTDGPGEALDALRAAIAAAMDMASAVLA